MSEVPLNDPETPTEADDVSAGAPGEVARTEKEPADEGDTNLSETPNFDPDNFDERSS